MSYNLFRFIMWVCSPIVSLMSLFCSATKVAFPAWVLFRNKYKVAFVIAQSAHESAIWKSDLYKRANNAFGMKPSKAKEFQDGVSGAYASYKHVWKSVYDYYNLIYKRIPSEGLALDRIPTAPYKRDSVENNEYVKYVCYEYKMHGYYGAPFDTYTAAVWLHTKSIGPLTWLPLSVIVLVCLLPVGAYFVIRYLSSSHAFKRKGKKGY